MLREIKMGKTNKDEHSLPGENLLYKARSYAKRAHKGQLDDEGKDYFTAHLSQVYEVLRQVTRDETILCAAWLHDVIEDTETTYYDLIIEFNQEIASLVMELTHEGSKTSGYYFPRLQTKEGTLVKFADRLSNLSRMKAWKESRQEQYVRKSRFWKLNPERKNSKGTKTKVM